MPVRRPGKPSELCATPGFLRRASSWANIQVIPNGITLLGDVLLQSAYINDIHVINPDAQLIGLLREWQRCCWLHLPCIRGDLPMTVLEGRVAKSRQCSCNFQLKCYGDLDGQGVRKIIMLLLIQLVIFSRAFDAKIGRELSGRLVAATGTARSFCQDDKHSRGYQKDQPAYNVQCHTSYGRAHINSSPQAW